MKLDIVYHYIAHYRVPLFEKLSNDSDIDLTVVAGVKSEIPIRRIKPQDRLNFKFKNLRNYWLYPFLWQGGLIRHCFNTRADTVVIIGVMYYLSTWLAVMILRKRGIRVVFWGHGFLKSELNFKERLRLRFFRLPDAHMVYSYRSVDLMRQRGLNNSFRIGNSLQSLNDLLVMPLADRRSKKDIVGFVGRLTEVKELDKIIYVVADLRNSGRDIHIEFIGDGVTKAGLGLLANQLNVPVKFYGALYEKEKINSIVKYWSCTLSPGNVGLSALESLAVGVPVISHNHMDLQMPEIEAITHRVTGSLFDRKSWKTSLRIELLFWLDNWDVFIPSTCRKEVIENWTIEEQIRSIKSVVC